MFIRAHTHKHTHLNPNSKNGKKEILLLPVTWATLEKRILSKMSQTWRGRFSHDLSLDSERNECIQELNGAPWSLGGSELLVQGNKMSVRAKEYTYSGMGPIGSDDIIQFLNLVRE